MTPSPSRAEVALRLACASASNFHGAPLPPKEFAASILSYADALLLALTPPVSPAPVAPKSEAAKYVPKVGDVVRFVVYGATNGDGVVVAIQREGVASIRLFGESVHALTWGRYFKDLAYLRPATPAERAAAGLPSPEATRPTWVRVTAMPKSGWRVTVGRIYKVSRWSEDAPQVLQDDGTSAFLSRPDGKDTDSMGYPSWDPATPPAPVEPAKGEDRIEAAAKRLDARAASLDKYADSCPPNERAYFRDAATETRECAAVVRAARGGS